MFIPRSLLCGNVTVRGTKVISHGPNNDACDFPRGYANAPIWNIQLSMVSVSVNEQARRPLMRQWG